MSSKIDTKDIISGHINTLKDSSTGKTSKIDLLVFYLAPLIASGLFIYFKINLSKEVASLLVNFGAIFTALLLSVLVLVYDQANKLSEKKAGGTLVNLKKNLLNELYYNICYSILISVALVVVCLIHSISHGATHSVEIPFINSSFDINYGALFFTPIAVFITFNVVLTIVMVVKRMHTLLTTS
ncbi:MAG: hypothetical protein ABW079_06700 [Sedimenticola sp.]